MALFLMRLDRATDTFFLKNIDTISKNLVIKNGEKIYKEAFEKVLESNLKAQANEKFLSILKGRLVMNHGFSLKNTEFLAYVYARNFLNEHPREESS